MISLLAVGCATKALFPLPAKISILGSPDFKQMALLYWEQSDPVQSFFCKMDKSPLQEVDLDDLLSWIIETHPIGELILSLYRSSRENRITDG